MALVFVGGTSGTGGSTDYSISLTSLTGGVGSAPQEGDIVIVVTGFAQGSDDNPGPTTAGYTEVADLYANDTADTNASVAYKLMGATPDTEVTVGGSASGTYGSATVVHVWRGVDSSNPMDVAVVTATGGNGTAIDSPSITPVTSGAVVLSCGLAAHASGGATKTAPSGYGNAVQALSAATRNSLAVIASKAWTSGAEDPGTWTGGSSAAFDSWAAATLALRPAAESGSDRTGSLSGTLGALTAVAAGTLTLAGALAGTFGGLTASGAGALALDGSADGTLAPLTVTAAGGGQSAIAGDLAVTFDALAADASGSLALQAQATNTLAAATVEAVGAVALRATASPTFTPASIEATAGIGLTGAASLTLDALTVQGGGQLPIAGTLTATFESFAPLTVAASSGALTLGEASLTFDALAGSATGALALQGIAAPTLDALTGSGAGTLTLRADASPTFAPATTTAAGALPLLASLNVTLGELTLTSAAAEPAATSPTFDYQPMADSATRMLARFGAAATLQRQTSTSYDPATGTGGVTETVLPTTAVVVSYQQNYIDGTLVQQGDRRALCDPNVEPKPSDRFIWQGEEYTVIGVTPVAPAGIPLLFEAQIRGG